jgi:anti-sigma B factor antagonist
MEIVGKKSEGISVDVREEAQTCVISFNDRSLNFYVTSALKDSLKQVVLEHIAKGARHFILDLGNVRIIDSCGVGLIIVANNLTSSRSARVYLANANSFIVKILDIMRISKHFEIFESSEAAVAAIRCA